MSHRERECSTELALVAKPSRRIVVACTRPLYDQIIGDSQLFRHYVDQAAAICPELFPAAFAAGYWCHDVQQSKKMPDVPLRRIKLTATGEVYTIVPSFVLPYRMGYVDDVEKALFLRRFGVPFWGLTYVFGRNDMYWQRLVQHLGRYDLVGTTIKEPACLPEHLIVDEKHMALNGERAFIAMTVGDECVLGAAVALKAAPTELTEAYGEFKQEALHLKPDYAPQTVNYDGWEHTRCAWQALFPAIVIIRCFLHAFLRIRDRCKRLDTYPLICHLVWKIYHASSQSAYYRDFKRFLVFAAKNLSGEPLKAVQRFKARRSQLLKGLFHPGCHRTSATLDRHMQSLTRCLYMARDFRGHRTSAHLEARAWALMHNFWPYCPRARARSGSPYTSPAHQLNRFRYHDNWLQNLLIATSCQSFYVHHKIR
jgi:hypothetical protein